jgi:membrane protease YdiL (CAAX protease family)
MTASSTLDSATDTRAAQTAALRQVSVFYALTMAIFLAVCVPYGAQLAGLLSGRIPSAIVILSQYSPTAAALILVFVEGRWQGLTSFLRMSLNPRVGPQWFLLALSTPLLMGLGILALHRVTGGYVPPLSALAETHQHLTHSWLTHADAGADASRDVGATLARLGSGGLIPALLVYAGVSLANGGISEEAGWRGYAVARLLPGRRAILVAIVVGFFWGLWHTGPAFWQDVFQGGGKNLAIPIEYTLGTIPLTVMITFVFIKARKSLLPGMVFHACYNGTLLFLLQIWTPGRPAISVVEWLAATYVAAALFVILGRKTLLARHPADEQAAAAV